MNNIVQLYEEEQPDINNILELADTVGEDGLLPEELELLREYTAKNEPQQPSDHYANLAEYVDDVTLNKLATEIINWTEWDEETREEWAERESKGIKLLGVSSKTEGGATFEGASKVVHPLLAEAVVQFHSRALIELWPQDGPVKTAILGDPTVDKAFQAERVQDYMNYLYTNEMPGAFEEEDQMLFRLPLSGSCFKKGYFDPIENTICSRLVEPADFIVPYTASDLRTAPRYTHRLREMRNDVLKKMASGYYKQENLGSAINEDYDYPRVKEEIDRTEGRNRANVDEDQRYTILEMYVDYDLPGFEDTNAQGEKTGIGLPYIITVNRDEQKVLRIQRNWRETDELRRKRIYFAHHKFMPGLGFYGYGLFHLIGGLSDSATGALRSLLDAAQLNNMPGGFYSGDSEIEGGETPLSAGEWRRVNTSAEELGKSFFKMPYSEPSSVLFNLLGYLDERGQRFVGTTENMVGEANNDAPVGTTLALIEQGSKTFTAIHQRLHKSHAVEFKIIHDLCYDYLPEEGYPYDIIGASKEIMASDFDGRVDVIPVSDPNTITSTQRIAQAQAILDLAEKHPNKVSEEAAIENMLLMLRVADIDKFMIREKPNPIQEEAIKLDLEERKAKIDKLKAEATVKNIEGQYSSVQAAQTLASVPGAAPIADELLMSAGYEDKNGPPIATPTPIEQTVHPQQNTDPRFPANPQSPAEGLMNGIETQGNDGVIE